MDGFVKDVREPPEKFVVGALGTVHRHVCPSPEAKDPEIVGSVDVVRMEVGEPHRLDVVHILSDQLKAKLRRGVHQKAPRREMEESSMASAPVPGVAGGARRTMAPDDGDAERCSSSEKSKFHAGLRGRRRR